MSNSRRPLYSATPPDPSLITAFARYLTRWLPVRPGDHDLAAALGAVKIVERQTGRKLSPTERPESRSEKGNRHGPRAVAPYCTATYSSFTTCPTTCPFLFDPVTGERRGCFAAADVNMETRWMRELDASAAQIQSIELRGRLIGLAEAFLILEIMPATEYLRLHVAGDVADATVVRALAQSIEAWRVRVGRHAWTYTHAWVKGIVRAVWGPIAAWASVETADGWLAATRLGYAAAITLPSFFAEPVALHPEVPGMRIFTCPQERERAPEPSPTCIECAFCLEDHRHVGRYACGFRIHGRDASTAGRSIAEVEEAARKVRSLRVLR